MMHKYSEYKATQTQWLGMLPSHWECKKIGSLFSERKTKVSDKDYAPLSVARIGVVPQIATVAKTNAGDNRKLVRVGDFAINSRSDRKGSCGISKLDGSVSLINIILTPRNEWNGRYVHYLLRSQPFSEEYYRNGRGIVADLWTTRFCDMKSILLPVPPREEQDQIVRFLDWKVSSINKLINIKRKEISELEILKTRTITEATVNGLDVRCQMKDSSSVWIGNIPKHWDVSPIRRNYTVVLGKMLAPAPTSESDTLEEYVCAKDVHFNGVTLSALKKMWFSTNEKKQYRIFNGDLLVVEGGAGAGNAAILEETDGKDIYVQNSIHIIRPKSTNAINEYLRFWLLSLVKRGYMKSVCSVATIPHYTKDKVMATPMPLPPLNEQIAIVNYLNEHCNKIDTAIWHIEEIIAKLSEYKARLVADTVTGKIDVRDIEIPEYEFVDEDTEADDDVEDFEESEAE